MSANPPKMMTALFVASTGHVLATVTRTDTSGTEPGIGDLATGGLIVRGIVTDPTAPPWKTAPGPFLIPTDALVTRDFQIDSTNYSALRHPRSYVVWPLPPTGTASPPPSTPPALTPINQTPLTATAATYSTGSLTITFDHSVVGQAYYVLLVSQVTNLDATPTVLLKVPPGTVTSGAAVSIPTGTLTVPHFSVLILVQNRLPVVNDI